MLISRRKSTVMAAAMFATIMIGCQPAESGGQASIEEKLAEVLAGEVTRFSVVEIDIEALAKGLDVGRITLPFTDEENNIAEVDLDVASVHLRAAGLTEAEMKTGSGQNETYGLPAEQNFRIGECAFSNQEFASCGSLTVLDEAQTMFGGMLVHNELGITYIEPADLLLDGELTGLHVIYNIKNTLPINFDDDLVDAGEASQFGVRLAKSIEGRQFAQAEKETQVVLDGDVQFFQLDPATVWSRQEEVFNAVATIYGGYEAAVFEPVNNSYWILDLQIKGQEVWVSGGPFTTNEDDLLMELQDANYLLLNPLTNTELHYFFVGYDLAGAPGVATQGNTIEPSFGQRPGLNHALGEAKNGMSLYSRSVIMGHELGHLIGATHEDATTFIQSTGCPRFLFFIEICGPSIMREVSFIQSQTVIFSDANDENIANVLNAVLP